MANQNGIDRNANAFKEGVEFGKKWVDYYRENGLPIEMPIFDPPKDIENQYYQSGVMETVNKAYQLILIITGSAFQYLKFH